MVSKSPFGIDGECRIRPCRSFLSLRPPSHFTLGRVLESRNSTPKEEEADEEGYDDEEKE